MVVKKNIETYQLLCLILSKNSPQFDHTVKVFNT